jgi:dienelactone hydrolase
MKSLAALFLAVFSAFAAPSSRPVRHSTPSGIPFAMLGQKAHAPSPTVFTFVTDMEQSIEDPLFGKMARELYSQRGYLIVSLDLPGHGDARKPGEPSGLAAWRARLEAGADPVSDFAAQVSAVLDYLIAEGYTDKERVAVSGTSRGGFMAFHVAARDARIRWVVAFAPVTDLIALTEFSGAWNHAPSRALALTHLAAKLAGRASWICIGNNDDRVGTDLAIAFSRRLVEAALARGFPPNVELHVPSSQGHPVTPDAHVTAAAWLSAQMDAAR